MVVCEELSICESRETGNSERYADKESYEIHVSVIVLFRNKKKSEKTELDTLKSEIQNHSSEWCLVYVPMDYCVSSEQEQ